MNLKERRKLEEQEGSVLLSPERAFYVTDAEKNEEEEQESSQPTNN